MSLVVSAGLAFVDSGETDVLCRPALLALEAPPRRAGLGVWREAVFDAVDGAALRAREGRFTVVQGRILHVGDRAQRVYPHFVRRGGDGLSVTVSKRTWRRVLERGLSAADLRGRPVRVRGVIEVRRGPAFEIAAADLIEMVDEADRGEQALRR